MSSPAKPAAMQTWKPMTWPRDLINWFLMVSFLNAKYRRWVENGHFQMLKKATDILRHLDFSISPFFVHAKGHPEKLPDDRHYFPVIQGFPWSHVFFFSFPKGFLKSVANVVLLTSYTKVVNLYSVHNFWTIMFRLKLAVDFLFLVYFCYHLAQWFPSLSAHWNHWRASETITTWVSLP